MKLKLILVCSLLLLVGCETIQEDPSTKSSKQYADFTKAVNIVILKDTSTGCEYVVIDENTHSTKMVPYYNAEGEVSGCGE